MHEMAKSRSPTPHTDYMKPDVAETLELLQKWNLLELQSQFKEHAITLRSLMYLTEEEICELAPKIGVRTIFRAMLKKWRETNDHSTSALSLASCSSTFGLDNDSYLDQIELKAECCSVDIDINDYPKDFFKQNQYMASNFPEDSNIFQTPTQPQKSTRQLRNQVRSYEGSFGVLDILKSCSDGQTVLDFYETHNFLDIKNRKRIVNLLIRNVVESKVEKYTAVFHDMTQQLLQIFPNEKYETYFVPHNGSNSARGALYYRYSNYTRQLRKEGLLAYKKSKTKNSSAK